MTTRRSLAEQKFGAAAADYAASAVHASGPSLARAVALASPQPDWRVLDVATGAGHTALAFAPRVKSVVASDITSEMLDQAAAIAAERGLANVETSRAEAGALPYDDASFDLVTCRLAAHHFSDPAAFVREAARVLKPGGTIALIDNISPDASTMPEASTEELHAAATIYNLYETLRDPSHARCLTLGEWLELLGDGAFHRARTEILDQDIAFDPWVKRMRCEPDTIERLRAMLEEPVLRTVLDPRVEDGEFMFTLKEAIIVAEKVQRE
jgi:SAM-dependent methyltransferase